MKKNIIVCDCCGCAQAQSYKHENGGVVTYTDLCVNCLQEFVLKNNMKLTPVNEEVNTNQHRQLLQD